MLKLLKFFIILFFILILALGIFFFIQHKTTHITTNDAYVRGHIHWIHPRIDGTVINVLIDDNQSVKKGESLVLLDPEEYEIELSKAIAEFKLANTKLKETEINVRATAAEVTLGKSEFVKAKADFQRAKALYKEKAMPKEKYEQYLTRYDVTKARLDAIQQKLKQAEIQVKTANARVNFSQTKVEKARLNLKYTVIREPVSGYITKKSVEIGQRVNPGQPLLAIVPLDNIWIEANYKESQLEKITPGQKVNVKIDAYPGKRFNAVVDSIQGGTGAVFSLFPPENATGNWVKVTQRIPVKIVLQKPDDVILRIGMSAVTTVTVN